MAHEILNNKFYSNGQPAWHGLGHTFSDPNITATDAHKAIGPVRIVQTPLTVEVNGVTLPVGDKALVQCDDDGNPVGVIGTVANRYEVITPDIACTALDMAMAIAHAEHGVKVNPIETMAYLDKSGKGLMDRFFVTTFQGNFDVAGDETEMYVLLYVPYTGNQSLEVRIVGNRVVCNNTLQMARSNSKQAVTLIHSEGVQQRLVEQLTKAYVGAQNDVQVFQDAMLRFSKQNMSDQDMLQLAEAVYKMPDQPNPDVITKNSIEERIKWYHVALDARQKKIELACAAFAGEAIGYDTMPRSLHGTAFMGYQAITEVETHRRGRGNNRIVNIFEGERRDVVELAFDYLNAPALVRA